MNKYQMDEKSKRNKKLVKIYIGIQLIFFITLLIINLILACNNKKNNIDNILTIQSIVGIITIIITIIIVRFLDKIYLKKYIVNKYNNVVLNNKIRKEIIAGDMKNEGCIRNKYLYSLQVPKYKCTLNRYYQQKLVYFIRNIFIVGYSEKKLELIMNKMKNHRNMSFHFITIENILEYVFQLDKSCWYLSNQIRNIIKNAEIIDDKIIIRRSLSLKRHTSILEEMNFIDDIEQIYLELINYIDKGETI